MEEYLITFAKNLKMLRDERAMSIRELAEAIGVSKSAISQYENCQNDPALSVVKKISDYFEVNIMWLIGETTERR